jgi:hypothetical protein
VTQPIVKKDTKKKSHSPKSANDVPRKEGAIEVVAAQVEMPKKKALAKDTTRPSTEIKSEQASTEASTKAKRTKKEKVVRDSFTMPKSDYDKIAALKQKCLAAGVNIKKGELLRAGLLMLDSAAPKALLAAVSAVEQVKTGRPAKS